MWEAVRLGRGSCPEGALSWLVETSIICLVLPLLIRNALLVDLDSAQEMFVERQVIGK